MALQRIGVPREGKYQQTGIVDERGEVLMDTASNIAEIGRIHPS
jgi:hypothetical protein